MLSSYLSEIINRYKVLDNETQLKLIQEAQNGDEEARDQLILCNLRLIVKIAGDYKCPNGFQVDDLVAEGISAINYSIDKYDPEKNVRIISFFGTSIRWFISKFCNRYKESSYSLNELIDSDREYPFEIIDTLECPQSQKEEREWESKEDLKFLFSFLNEEEQIVLILSYGIFGFDQYAAEEMRPIFNRSAPAIISLKMRTLEKMKKFANRTLNEVKGNLSYPFIDLNYLQQLIRDNKMVSKKEKWEDPQKRRKGMQALLDLTEVEHDFVFKQGVKPDLFIEKYKGDILRDYHLGCNRAALARKYRCPTSLITKLVREEEKNPQG